MKHQGKQFLAWMTALGVSSGIYAGGSVLVKRIAKKTSSSHETPEHGEASADAHGAPEHGDSHAAAPHASGHEEKHDAHAAAPQGHDEHGKKEVAAAHDSHNTHGEAAAKKEEHAPAHHEEKHAAAAEKPAHDSHAAAAPAAHKAEHKSEHKQEKVAEHHADKPHWDYKKDSENGPSNWASLDSQFAQCEKGREQSPIDLKGAVTYANAPQIEWHYNPTAINVENNGHTIVANMPHTQNYVTIDHEKYTLAQFHFHNPSEHKIAGAMASMEVHFVHKSKNGGLAVIGVMMQEKSGSQNQFLKPLWEVLPREMNSKAEATPSLNLTKLLPTHREYFHYSGSLTTPPCSQGVKWFVLKDPIYISGSQADLYTGIFDSPTNRPVQPLFGREVIQNSGPATVAH